MMVRLMIGAALAYGAYRIGRELLDSVPDIERGPNGTAITLRSRPAAKPARATTAKRRPARRPGPAAA